MACAVDRAAISLNIWWKYSRDLAQSGFDAQCVIALRFLKPAVGGPAAAVEARRMLFETWTASVEAAATVASDDSAPKVLKTRWSDHAVKRATPAAAQAVTP